MIINHNNIQFKSKTKKTEVPDDPISKIQYYLNIVLGLIEIDKNGIFGKISNYHNNQLSVNQFSILVNLCAKFSPDVLLGKCIFIQPDLVPNGWNNYFYEIAHVRNTLAIVPGVIIEGQNRKVKEIMVCHKKWLLENYYLPLLNIQEALKNSQEQQRLQQKEQRIQRQRLRQQQQQRARHQSYSDYQTNQSLRSNKIPSNSCCSLM